MKARETIEAIGFVTLVGAPTVAVAAGIVQAAAAGIDLLVLARSNARNPLGPLFLRRLALTTRPARSERCHRGPGRRSDYRGDYRAVGVRSA
jgi:hypothetical protein